MSGSIKLTNEQEAAVFNSGGSLLVSAAAGAGKTMVLVERLMHYLTASESESDITDFLVITYTRAAAAELRSKILNKITEISSLNPDNRHLRRQASLCLKANISTIHSFCTEIIRENAHMLDIPHDFRVLDGEESEIIKADTLDKVLENRYLCMDSDSDFRTLVDFMAESRGDSKLREAILNAYSSLQSHPQPARWINEQLKAFSMEGVKDISETVWGKELVSWARRIIEHIRGAMVAKYDEMSSYPEALKAYGTSYKEMIRSYDDFLEALEHGWDEAVASAVFQFPGVKPLKGFDDIKKTRNMAKSSSARVSTVFSTLSDSLIDDMKTTYPAVSSFLNLLLDFDRAYSKEKKQRGVIDYSDQEHMCLNLLYDFSNNKPTDLAASMSNRFREILVDEYQDINAVQELIFNSVSNKGKNLFMVGDVKQSIYRFRLADPTIFIKKYTSFKPADQVADGEARKIVLSKNFRSKKGILDAVNYMFSNLMSKQLGELDYTSEEYLTAGRDSCDSHDIPVEFDVLDTTDIDDDPNINPEADFIADRIRSLLSSGMLIPDGTGGTRPLEASDICILLRSLKGKAPIYASALLKKGIPVAMSDTGSYFETLEISVIYSLLSVIDNPMQDVPLITVLKSPLFKFEPDELAEIRASNRDCDFYSALCKYADKSEKCKAFLDQLNVLRRVSRELSAEDLIFYILDSTSLYAIAGAMVGGRTRQANLMLFAQYAREYENNGYRGLFGFITHIRKMIEQEKDSDPADARIAPNGVSLMTIHKSKGLEYPVVIIADTSKRFNLTDASKPVLFQSELGVGFKCRDLSKRIQFPTIARDAVACRINLDSLSEELRVLYVAMTRAKEKLIITASFDKADAHINNLLAETSVPVSPGVIESKNCYADWLMLVSLTRPESSVFGVCPATSHTQELGSQWSINYIKLANLGQYNQNEKDFAQIAPLINSTDKDDVQDIDNRNLDIDKLIENLNWKYPAAGAEAIPAKMTATELKGRSIDSEIYEDAKLYLPKNQDDKYRRPVFLSGKYQITAAEKGTAIHAAMNYADLNRCTDLQSTKLEIERLNSLGYLTEQQASVVDPYMLLEFVTSPLGQRVLAAKELHREFKFSVLLPARTLGLWSVDDKILFQGAIDCWFEDNDGITIIDFKTDRITDENFNDRIIAYTTQVNSYSLALHSITGKKIAHCILYFFSNSMAVDLIAQQK